MAYITPITDRNSNDISQHNSRAHFAIVDWERIDNNTTYAKGLIESVTGMATIATQTLTAPDMLNDPTATDINEFVANINLVKIAANLATTNQYTLNEAWVGGALQTAPDYQTVNTWEYVIDLIVTYFETKSRGRNAVTGLGRVGAGMTQQNGFRRF
jgi:DNA phosphorothioation-dependent restriction protein DptG